MSNEELLDSLGLLVDGKLKRAAVMLFYRKPERLITGSFVKIGKFGEGADLQYQDELRGSLFIIADRIMELIYVKYLKTAITYDKDIRIETYPYPREGVREAVYNALMHTNWTDSVPIQIRIEDDAMYITNSCVLPHEWTAKKLMERHSSKPYNPDIANAFFRAGYVETWGRGIQKICEACKQHGSPEPEYEVFGGDITVKFTALKNPKVQNFTKDFTIETLVLNMIKADNSITISEMSKRTSVTGRTIQNALNHLKAQGKIERKGG